MPGPRRITGTTRLAAVIGDPIEHSLSPVLLNAAFAAADLDWVFVALEVGRAELASALSGARAAKFAGLSVTTPHKSDVVRLVDRLAPSAEAVGAVNCIACNGSQLVGHNTDGAGVVGAAREIGFTGGSALVLGAGGAARAAVAALTLSGSEVGVWARRPEAAAAVAALGGREGRAVKEPDPSGWDLVVNATSVGMSPGEPSPLTGRFSPGQAVVEMVYASGETATQASAREAGCAVSGGARVLLHQAAEAFQIWTGDLAPMAAMGDALSWAQESGTMDR